MKINELADKVYLINLERRKDRLEKSTKLLNENNIVFERFDAVDGKTLINNTYMNAGQYGNYISHLRVLNKCLENDVDVVAIFEDDVEFCENFEKEFNRLYEHIPNDWDMIYLGFNTVSSSTEPTDHPEIIRIRNGYAIHAFILNRKTIEIAHEHFTNNNVQADIYYASLQNELKAYSFVSQLCSQSPDFSDIEEQNVDYRWIFKW
jgi:GR25 family glycosyltransferase involved in LPS biosynthesis